MLRQNSVEFKKRVKSFIVFELWAYAEGYDKDNALETFKKVLRPKWNGVISYDSVLDLINYCGIFYYETNELIELFANFICETEEEKRDYIDKHAEYLYKEKISSADIIERYARFLLIGLKYMEKENNK